jgi:hypothetical protein
MELLSEDIAVVFSGRDSGDEERDFVRGDASQQIEAVLIPTRPVPLGDEPAREILVARSGQFTTPSREWEVEVLSVGLVEAAAGLLEDQRETPEPETVEPESPDEE